MTYLAEVHPAFSKRPAISKGGNAPRGVCPPPAVVLDKRSADPGPISPRAVLRAVLAKMGNRYLAPQPLPWVMGPGFRQEDTEIVVPPSRLGGDLPQRPTVGTRSPANS